MPSFKLGAVFWLIWTTYGAWSSPVAAAEFKVGGTRIDLEVLPGPLVVAPADVEAWIESATDVIAGYYGRFPVPHLRIRIVPVDGERISGRTWGGRVPFIRILLGEHVDTEALRLDWVLTHEMAHTAFPRMGAQHGWVEEGLATYVEAVARARSKRMTEQAFWEWLSPGLEIGARAAARGGLNDQNDWGSTYWGGALYFLLADLAVRDQTDGRFGLEDALLGIVVSGGTVREQWTVDAALEAADRAVGVKALSELYQQMGTRPFALQLPDLLSDLGVTIAAVGLELDDGAPLARDRKAITRAD